MAASWKQSLDLDDEPVLRQRHFNFFPSREHLAAEVGQDDPAGSEAVAVFGEPGVVQVKPDAGFEEGAFADQEVRSLLSPKATVRRLPMLMPASMAASGLDEQARVARPYSVHL